MSNTKSASELAYLTVKEMIVTGELPGGELVSEGDIAGRMDVSRTPVREAFLRLQVEGWMRLYPKRGALVVPVAPGEAENIVSARWLIESGSVRALVGDARVRAELVGELRTNLVRQHRLLARDTGQETTAAEFSAADADFHRLIVHAGGNPLLDAFYSGLRERQRRMTTHSLARDPGQIEQIVEDHTRLADFIEAGDADGFETAVDAHMRRVHGLNESGTR
ncbi:GntR family transcriptional regulator [Rhodococcoides yunnanense]|uniref:GntR family transcriptional regulator n=1 Tax=Rhodococcoides yunnanense TaxID=278209 RepID=UPI00093453BA|nr:GntR family transcriptional regulator [Rhodococcus yunnanensis]